MSQSTNQGLSDLGFDSVTIVQKKAKAVNAYEKYIADARAADAEECARALEQIRQDDLRHLEEAKRHLQFFLTNPGVASMEGNLSGQQ